MRSRLLLLAVALLFGAQSACSDAYGGVFPWMKRPVGVATNPTNLVLDATAHPTDGSNLFAAYDHSGGAVQNITIPSFSTGSGNHLFVVGLYADGSAVPFGSGATVQDNFGLSTVWTNRVNKASTGTFANEWGSQIWTGYVNGTISGKTITFHTHSSSTSQKMSLVVLVINGVPATEAGSIGNNGGFVDSAGNVNTLVNATVNASAAKSWIVVACEQANGDAVALLADSNTTPWDKAAQVGTGGGDADYYGVGRYKSGGVAQATSGTGNVTLGSSTSDVGASCAALEILSS